MPETMPFPTLYKKSGSGALQQWRIWVKKVVRMDDGTRPLGEIHTEHGQVDGKLQEGIDLVTKGKNIGKKNETDAYEQACLEAQAKWEKKIAREGYVPELERASAGETNVEGGIFPMLAKSLEDNKVWLPGGYDYQRKLNGVRCLVDITEGVVSLWSRKHKPILGVPHIKAAYEKAFAGVPGNYVFDGEVYRHGWSLQKISGYTRKEKTKPGFENLSHCIYDIPSLEAEWEIRRIGLEGEFALIKQKVGQEIKLVETIHVDTEEQARAQEKIWVGEGYEGGILRNVKGKYEAGKRSANLLKVKSFKDAEYEIIGVKEGRGKFEGLAVFECKTDEGKTFDCCAPGDFEDRAEFFRRGDELIGKLLTVKYFEMTDENKPCFPVGMAVRDYE